VYLQFLQLQQLPSACFPRRVKWWLRNMIFFGKLPSMSSLVSCLLTLRLYQNDCDFDSRPLFLVSLFLSLHIHIHIYILLLYSMLYFLVLTKLAPAWVHVKGGPEPSEKLICKVLVPIGRFHFYFIPAPKQIRPYHPTWYIFRTRWSVFRSARK